MAKFLRIDPDADPATGALRGPNYRLPDEVDVASLADQLGEAFASGDSLTIPLNRLNDSTPVNAYVVINCSLVRQVLIGEAPEPAPTPAPEPTPVSLPAEPDEKRSREPGPGKGQNRPKNR
jgi:hypothetical protein